MPLTTFSDTARTKLLEFDYPGNVRELRNIIERALIDSGGGTIDVRHLRFDGGHVEVQGAEDSEPRQRRRPLRFRPDSDEGRVLEYIRENGAINNTESVGASGPGVIDAGAVSYNEPLRGMTARSCSACSRRPSVVT